MQCLMHSKYSYNLSKSSHIQLPLVTKDYLLAIPKTNTTWGLGLCAKKLFSFLSLFL